MPVNVNVAASSREKELEKFEARGGTPNGSHSTPTGLSEVSYVLPSRTYSVSLASSPHSGVKSELRGFPKIEPTHQYSVATSSPYTLPLDVPTAA